VAILFFPSMNFMLQVLQHVYQVLQQLYQALQHKFQALQHKMYWGIKEFSLALQSTLH
jgi:hypothetical protein